MSAALLRTAAERLREAAEGATGGRWTTSDDGLTHPEGTEVVSDNGEMVTAECCGYTGSVERPDARYIALVDPVVGAKLADWLDAEAQAAETWADVIAESGLDRAGTHALRIARAVLGEEA